jgi:hypothetical protein
LILPACTRLGEFQQTASRNEPRRGSGRGQPSTRTTSVSVRTPSYFIASAPASLSMMSGTLPCPGRSCSDPLGRASSGDRRSECRWPRRRHLSSLARGKPVGPVTQPWPCRFPFSADGTGRPAGRHRCPRRVAPAAAPGSPPAWHLHQAGGDQRLDLGHVDRRPDAAGAPGGEPDRGALVAPASHARNPAPVPKDTGSLTSAGSRSLTVTTVPWSTDTMPGYHSDRTFGW